MAIEDVPERDGLDGADQLLRLRAYLHDTADIPYQFPDAFLISLLVLNERNYVWRSLLSIPELTEVEVAAGLLPTIAFSYDADSPLGRVATVRAMTNDLVETTVVHTDYKIDTLIEVMPLKRVVQAILANVVGSTLPADVNHPLRIIRELIGDTDTNSPINTDAALMTALLENECNPFEYVLSLIDRSIAINSTEKGQEASIGFAAIDGISFSSDKVDGSIETAQSHREVVVGKMGNSVYGRDDIFAVFQDGVDVSTGNVGAWYAV